VLVKKYPNFHSSSWRKTLPFHPKKFPFVALSEKSPEPSPTFPYRTTTVVKAKSNGSSLVGDYTAAGGDSYAGGPQRGSNYGTPQSYHPYRR